MSTDGGAQLHKQGRKGERLLKIRPRVRYVTYPYGPYVYFILLCDVPLRSQCSEFRRHLGSANSDAAVFDTQLNQPCEPLGSWRTAGESLRRQVSRSILRTIFASSNEFRDGSSLLHAVTDRFASSLPHKIENYTITTSASTTTSTEDSILYRGDNQLSAAHARI